MNARWHSRSLDDLRAFLSNGLGEDHYHEFKADLPANNRMARQMAAFAVDGGDIYVGVAERDEGFAIEPLALAGLPERVEQIALTRVDPPLLVETHELRSLGEPSVGVLRIAVPPSPEAPHQVGGVYYKRAGKQSLPMQDPEVERLIRSRRITLDSVRAELSGKLDSASFPAPGGVRLIGLAHPIGAPEEEFYDSVGGADPVAWQRFFDEVMLGAAATMQRSMPGATAYVWDLLYGPELVEITPGPRWRFGRRSDAIVCDATVGNDGSFIYRSDRVSRHPERLLILENVVGACLDILVVAQAITQQTGSRRRWDLALGVVGAEGMRGHSAPGSLPFPDERYERARRVGHLQLTCRPWEIARSLVHGFTEGCGVPFEQIAKFVGYKP